MGEVVLGLFDELINDEQSSGIIEMLDSATNDTDLKKAVSDGIKRLRELGKNDLANKFDSLKGF